MSHVAVISIPTTEDDASTYDRPSTQGLHQVEGKVAGFVAELRQMTREERINASRYSMNLRERTIYAVRFPEEVPTVNGDLEWIACLLE